MKLQALFSSKNKSKIIEMSFAAIFVWRFKGKGHLLTTCYYPTFNKEDR